MKVTQYTKQCLSQLMVLAEKFTRRKFCLGRWPGRREASQSGDKKEAERTQMQTEQVCSPFGLVI